MFFFSFHFFFFLFVKINENTLNKSSHWYSIYLLFPQNRFDCIKTCMGGYKFSISSSTIISFVFLYTERSYDM